MTEPGNPPRRTRSEIEELVAAVLDTVPPPFSDALAECAVVVEERSPADMPDLYGLYIGAPPALGPALPGPPPRIAIYVHPLVEHFPGDDDLRRQVRITVLHELGHHMGLDEDRLDELGYA